MVLRAVFQSFINHSFISYSLEHSLQTGPHPQPQAKGPSRSMGAFPFSEGSVMSLGSSGFGGLREKETLLGAEGPS